MSNSFGDVTDNFLPGHSFHFFASKFKFFFDQNLDFVLGSDFCEPFVPVTSIVLEPDDDDDHHTRRGPRGARPGMHSPRRAGAGEHEREQAQEEQPQANQCEEWVRHVQDHRRKSMEEQKNVKSEGPELDPDSKSSDSLSDGDGSCSGSSVAAVVGGRYQFAQREIGAQWSNAAAKSTKEGAREGRKSGGESDPAISEVCSDLTEPSAAMLAAATASVKNYKKHADAAAAARAQAPTVPASSSDIGAAFEKAGREFRHLFVSDSKKYDGVFPSGGEMAERGMVEEKIDELSK